MTEIRTGRNLVTLINVFTVEPAQQQRLVDVLVEATHAVMNGLPGFISANIHRSIDGTRVVNYAQWRSREDFERMLQQPDAIPDMREAGRLASFEPNLYEVVYVDEAADTRDADS